jgi:hypothetical protein
MGQIGEQLFRDMQSYATGPTCAPYVRPRTGIHPHNSLPIYNEYASFYGTWQRGAKPIAALVLMEQHVPGVLRTFGLRSTAELPETEMEIRFAPAHYLAPPGGTIMEPPRPNRAIWSTWNQTRSIDASLEVAQGGETRFTFGIGLSRRYDQYLEAATDRGIFAIVEQFDERFPNEATTILRGLQALRQAHYQNPHG